MYAGHAALALLAKGARPKIPLAVLVPVAFAPDWAQWVIEAFHHENRQYTHSLIAIGICSAITALAYWAVTSARVDALVVWATFVSHWFADLITGIKPTWPGGPNIGLELYQHPVADVVLECVLIVLCWLVYRRSLPPGARRRPIGLVVPLGLIGMQFGFAAIQQPAIKEPIRQIIVETR